VIAVLLKNIPQGLGRLRKKGERQADFAKNASVAKAPFDSTQGGL
jgi:hypothetical protein